VGFKLVANCNAADASCADLLCQGPQHLTSNWRAFRFLAKNGAKAWTLIIFGWKLQSAKGPGCGDATRPLLRVLRDSAEAQQSDHVLDQRSKMEEVLSNMVRRRDWNVGQSRRRWVRSCNWCPQVLQEDFVLSCIEEKKEGYDRGSEVGIVNCGEARKGQFLWGNWRNLVKENCEKDFVSKWKSGCALSLQWQGLVEWRLGAKVPSPGLSNSEWCRSFAKSIFHTFKTTNHILKCYTFWTLALMIMDVVMFIYFFWYDLKLL